MKKTIDTTPDAKALPETQAQPGASEPQTPPPSARPDPTRYGDWELNGKCVDF